jgi:hypothetical protein
MTEPQSEPHCHCRLGESSGAQYDSNHKHGIASSQVNRLSGSRPQIHAARSLQGGHGHATSPLGRSCERLLLSS